MLPEYVVFEIQVLFCKKRLAGNYWVKEFPISIIDYDPNKLFVRIEG